MKEIYKIVSIADIHMGVLDPGYMYAELHRQFVERISELDLDILAICGDIFDSRFMSNNPVITYTMMLMDEIVRLCRDKDAAIIIIEGTQSHDNGQLSLFYHYLQDPSIDIHIVEDIRIEQVKGLNVLCIPEKYGVHPDEYYKVFYESGGYDLCLLHGTYKGSIYGSDVPTLESNHVPVFCMKNFENCAGPILMGHVHVAGNYEEYAYYNGSPLRFQFGEEQEKGFLVTLMNTTTRMHYTELIPIDSYKYVTCDINDIIKSDPKEIIEHIKKLKEDRHIDFIRLQYDSSNDNNNMAIVRNYFRNNSSVKLHEIGKKDKQMQQIDETILEQNSQYSYILDTNISEFDKFVMYINQNEGDGFITVDELVSLLEEDY